MDRDKVIKGMEQFRADIKPFCGGKADWERFDAGLALLKEQEAILIKADKPWNKYNCPACNAPLHRTTWFTFQTRFCKYCGQAVKWD